VRKGSNGEDGYSAFSMRDPVSGETVPTELAGMLADVGATKLVIVGLATDYCVKSTVLDARSHGYPATVIENAVRAVNLQPGDADKAVEEMLGAGALLESRHAR
jgi:nicotinamidase/pyrazinamidase